MSFIQKCEYVALVGMLAVLGILCMTSISFAKDNAWTTKANILTERSGLSTCVVNGKIYVIGGVRVGYGSTIETVEEYNHETDTWTTKNNMPTPRSWFAACAVNGKIYVIGGGLQVLGTGLSTVDEYDPVADTWTNKTDMPTARFVLSACVVDGKIYAIGGKPGHGVTPLTTVEEYDPATDTWTTKTGMNKERFGLSTCVVNGKIYAIGGSAATGGNHPGLATVEEYDPVTDTWTTKTDMLSRRAYFSASAVNGKIYAIGGGRDLATSGLSTVEEYDPAADTWTAKTDMPTARFLLSTSAVNNKIYAIGGAVTSWSSQPGWQACSTVEEYDPLSDVTSLGNLSWGHNQTEILLHQNYPNAFNSEAQISYNIPKCAHVTLNVINLFSQDVCTQANEYKTAGFYEVIWDGKNERGQLASRGVYLYRYKSNEFVQNRKIQFLQ